MNAGTTIRKVFFIALWIAIGGGMFTLLMAAIGRKNNGNCRDYIVNLAGGEQQSFMTRAEIVAMIEEFMNGPVKGMPVAAFNLREMEDRLEQDSWIRQAELYFDSRDVLHINVSERAPVARVFTNSESSFYIDSLGNQMPVSSRRAARVITFTGFPARRSLAARDSVLLQEVTRLAKFIQGHELWKAQVSQVDILPDRRFEIIPLVGDHLVRIGDASNLEAKFRRLEIFYRQVLAKAGMDAYATVDVQYRGQVVASRQQGESRVDSARIRKNVEKLMRRPGLVEEIKTADREEDPPVKKEETALQNKEERAENDKAPVVNKEPGQVKEKQSIEKNPKKRVPKAVMPPREKTNEEEQH